MTEKAYILFDGYCKLCSASVRFIKRHSRDGSFIFVPVGSEEANELLSGFRFTKTIPDAVILVSGEVILTRSRAALKIAARLNFPFKLLVIFYLVPDFLRDPVYDFIAGRRYRWFGKRDQCYLP